MSDSSAGRREHRIREVLSTWYRGARRDLPWRRSRDPYAIWVSEMVCQQTRVAAAIPYYDAFIEEFPTVRALAEAPVDRVFALWSGLGYYARARNFHAAARQVMESHGGQVPTDREAFRALPGVGDYTAAAVLSIAWGVPLAAVDGNVRRVLSRLDDLDGPSPASLQDRATQLLDRDAPGEWNQAVMELGALVCTPAAPRCDECPLSSHCLALERETVAERPGPRRKTKVRNVHLAAVWDSTSAGVVLEHRPVGGGIWPGLWMTPLVELEPGDDPVAACVKEGLVGGARTETDPVIHVLSHRRIHLQLVKGSWPNPGVRRVLPSHWNEIGVPAALHRLLEAIERISIVPQV